MVRTIREVIIDQSLHCAVETGEEEEEVVFSCRAKLYNYVKVNETKKEWKERGLGLLKLNRGKVNDEDEKDASTKARLIMRADGSHRVVLNSPIKKELKFGNPDGKAPSGGYLYFWGSVDGKPHLELLQLKVSLNNRVVIERQAKAKIDETGIRFTAIQARYGSPECDVIYYGFWYFKEPTAYSQSLYNLHSIRFLIS